MAYKIDFTESNYANRSRRKVFLRLLLLAAVGGVAWGVCDAYKIYNQPTLNMKLSDYEAVARPIEEINCAWDAVAKEYGAMMRYYRLIWASNPTNLLEAMVADVRNKATGRASYLVSQVERSLADTRDAVAADKIKPIDAALDELKQTLEASNHAVLTEEIALKQQNLTEAVEAVATNATSSVRLRLTDSLTGLSNLGSSNDAPILGRGFKPIRWTLKTGGECRLDYRYVFYPGDKAEQAKGIEALVVNAVTSAVAVVSNKVEVQGVQTENLLNVDELRLAVNFSLPDVKAFPAKEKALSDCVGEIAAMRQKVQDAKIADEDAAAGGASTANAIMRAYLEIGKDKPDFPAISNVVSVADWFDRADKFIAKNRIPGDDAKRRRLKEAWNETGDARFPWDRFRALDNDELVDRTKSLRTVSDGVKRFKGFLDQRRTDCRKKLEPFIEAYDRNMVFNEPIVETDLKGRFAKSAGIVRAKVAFNDEPGAAPALLAKDDESFAFTWVRWKLLLGALAEGDMETSSSDKESPLTIERIADCAVRVQKRPGPGYVLDVVKVYFGENGSVSSVVMEGLLPVKKTESQKGASGADKQGTTNS